MRSKKPIERVLILGGGSAGWMAAAVLSKALGARAKITLIESEEIGIVGVGEATIPMIRNINAFLGIDEDAFVRATNGTFKLGIEFNDWARLGDRYIHAFGDIGFPLGFAPFHHFVLRAGDPQRLWDYSLNARAAYADRFGKLERVGETRLSGVKWAFHFDAALYAKFLRNEAEKRGVARIEGKVAAARLRDDGFIARVDMEDGRAFDADLFIDCSGFRAVLIEGALGSGFEDWTRFLPCDRAVAAPCAHGRAIRPFTQSSAQKAGWQWRIPLQSRVGNGHVYCSAMISDDEAERVLRTNLEGAIQADPRIIRFRTGMRREVWKKNCVALGLASGFMEPLESTSIHLVQSVVSRLVSMFPDRAFDDALIAEFNRQTRFEYERIRDFLILHYHANERDDSEFWRACRAMAIPDTLSAKIDLFRASGRVYREHEELFTESGWTQVMIGQRIIPESYHPLADQVPLEHAHGFLRDVKASVERAVASLPMHEDFISKNCKSAA
jgi:tryptophan halogenase